MKGYTDIEQSRKLAEILSPESADMHYSKHPLENYYSSIALIGKYSKIHDEMPCWSLASLLGVLPNNKHISTNLSRGGWKIEPIEYIDKWFCEYEDEDSPCRGFTVSADNPVDACYEVIIKLYELKML